MRAESRESRAGSLNLEIASAVGRRAIRVSYLANLLLIFSAVALGLSYWTQPDLLFGITVWPAWCWVGAACLVLALFARHRPQLTWKLAVASWVLFALFFVQVPRSLFRIGSPSIAAKLRVVTLNCGNGGVRGIDDLAPLKPDLVLLQESPSRSVLADWSNTMHGELGAFIASPDAAIIARGTLQPIELPVDCNAVAALWEPGPDLEIIVVSLRLQTPPVRLGFWNPDYWRTYAAVRQQQRMRLQLILEHLREHTQSHPVILGGDFNSPAGDALDDILQQQGLQDVFRSAGSGWGNTITNEFPVHRIDRVWVSNGMQAARSFAQQTVHSDHRLVVCDLADPRD